MNKFNGVEIADLGNKPTTGLPVRVITVDISLKEYPSAREVPLLWGGFIGWDYCGNDTIDRGKLGTARLQTFVTTVNSRHISIIGADESDVMSALRQVEDYLTRLNEPLSCELKQKVDEADYDDFF